MIKYNEKKYFDGEKCGGLFTLFALTREATKLFRSFLLQMMGKFVNYTMNAYCWIAKQLN